MIRRSWCRSVLARTTASVYALLLTLVIASITNIRAQHNHRVVLSSKSSEDQSVGVTKIKSLKVRIITDRRRGAGTDNAVYFDIGPLAWKLNKHFHNDFEGESDDSYELKVPDDLTTDEILWLRLHKKGLLGVTGTKDGLVGAWHPKTIVLIVNDVEFRRIEVDTPLNSSCWYWRSAVTNRGGLSLLARSLRIKPNKRLNFLDKFSGFFTTPIFKKNGISGWLSNPSEKECRGSFNKSHLDFPSSLCASGEVLRHARSTDGLQTIDMKVGQIESCPTDNIHCSKAISVDAAHGFQFPRYIRIENRYEHKQIQVGPARICGKLLWDTDREGWWEIHPRSAKDLLISSK